MTQAFVAVLMGSDSDLPVMQATLEVLDKVGYPPPPFLHTITIRIQIDSKYIGVALVCSHNYLCLLRAGVVGCGVRCCVLVV